MERVVVDSNVLVKWFIPEDYSEYARLLRNDHLLGCVEAVAPTYALLEFYNTLRKYYAKGILDKEKVYKIVGLLHEAKITLVDIERDTLDQALEYSLQNHITVYDAYYIVLAHNLDTVVYTADEKLLKRLGKREPRLKSAAERKLMLANHALQALNGMIVEYLDELLDRALGEEVEDNEDSH